MNCTVDYSVMGRVVDHCARQDFFGYIVLAVLVAIICLVVAIASQKENSNGNRTSRSIAPRPTPAKAVPQDEELPELSPVAASVAPEAELPVTAVPVVEPAPAPVDTASDWSRPVFDEAVLSIPAYIRRAGLTPYAAYRRLNPLKTPVVLLSKARKPELDSEPVFDFGERVPVGFDGVPVY